MVKSLYKKSQIKDIYMYHAVFRFRLNVILISFDVYVH